MEREQSLELLNATHEFPCAFTLKVIGVHQDDFVLRVVEAVVEVISCESPPYSTRETPKGNHVSITLEPTLESAEQVLEVYERLRSVEGIVMTM